MLRIQYGMAGFFVGAFLGLLLGILEMHIINKEKHPAMLFIVIALTIITCGIIGISGGVSMARKKLKQ
ncbi:MAG: hypothetical protein ABIO04_12755 [Ferruginibacter sp.]